MIMCAQVLELVQNKHRGLVGVARSSSTRHRPNQTLPAALNASMQNTARVQHDDTAVLPAVIREVTTSVRSSSVDDRQPDTDQSFADQSFTDHLSPAVHTVDGNTMMGAVNKIADAVHLLSVRVDAVDRRLVQLEAVERRVSEFSDMNRRLMEIQQRVARMEQTLTTSGGDKTDGSGPEAVDAGDNRVAVVSDVDGLAMQLNNLSARMTLAENQLMLQSSRRRSMFPEPTSSCVQFPSITDDVQTNGNDRFTPAEHSANTGATESHGCSAESGETVEPRTDEQQDDGVKAACTGTSARSEQLERIEAMLRGTEELLQKRSDLSLA